MIPVVQIEGAALVDLADSLERYPTIARQAARIAINATMDGPGMTMLRESVLDQIAFPSSYLNGERLKITKRAKNDDLEGTITARQRPTSLARFATGKSPSITRRQGQVQLRIKPGRVTSMPGAFLIRLRSGLELTDDSFNLGLAIRLKPGESIRGKNVQGTKLDGGLTLLYGPSVDQVFRDVATEDAERVGDLVETEFYRQFQRLSND